MSPRFGNDRPIHLPLRTGQVRDLSPKHDVVISCGGLGPTPDDVTMEAMSEAFRMPLAHSQELFECLMGKYDHLTGTCAPVVLRSGGDNLTCLCACC